MARWSCPQAHCCVWVCSPGETRGSRGNEAYKFTQLKPWEGMGGGVSAVEGGKLRTESPRGSGSAQVSVSLAGAVSQRKPHGHGLRHEWEQGRGTQQR